jgi:hypothetical protein
VSDLCQTFYDLLLLADLVLGRSDASLCPREILLPAGRACAIGFSAISLSPNPPQLLASPQAHPGSSS